MKPHYCAIIGDINKSRALERRGAVQKKFEAAIDTINKEYKDEIASKFLITIGDEFQGILKSPAESHRLVRSFQELMNGISFAFGIGVGTLSTELNPVSAIGMDGECFHHARSALQAAKSGGQEVLFSFNDPAVPLLNVVTGEWESRRRKLGETVQKIMELHKSGKSQMEIASVLKVSQQFVSKSVNSKQFKEIVQFERVINEFLANADQKSMRQL
ncbi:MAG: hypothetical protein HYV29_06165 [Ignavibacteriales bacterium]|nr:hypothetical protein [Ignavibacteriales bacterium]